MAGLLENLSRITDATIPDDSRRFAIRDFAERLDWTPSYELKAPVEGANVFDHVIVEHGLSNSAVITFLRGNSRASDLSPSQLRSLLKISYNNLIDWHYFVSQYDARRIYNLIDPTSSNIADETYLTSTPDFEGFLSSSRFARDSSRRIRPQERPCDDALMAVVEPSYRYKRGPHLHIGGARPNIDRAHVSLCVADNALGGNNLGALTRSLRASVSLAVQELIPNYIS